MTEECEVTTINSLLTQLLLSCAVKNAHRFARRSALTRKFIQAGLIFGVVLAILGRCTPIIAGCFTNDLAVKSAVKGLAPTLAIVFSVHGVVCAGEGALLAMKDLKFMAMSYTGFFFR